MRTTSASAILLALFAATITPAAAKPVNPNANSHAIANAAPGPNTHANSHALSNAAQKTVTLKGSPLQFSHTQTSTSMPVFATSADSSHPGLPHSTFSTSVTSNYPIASPSSQHGNETEQHGWPLPGDPTQGNSTHYDQ
ncbi:hypothetical protein H2203_003579 [Taxawa tesnikishii (nom. ined.)]|nr:hypothetical protein H2203_003579 [Dothideales sp. JES 119]